MTSLSTQPYKGARDFYPEDKRIQKYMFRVMRSVVERFGYEEYDAPILEPLELYLAKTGQEIVDEQTYTFTDRGDRKVAIRPEMTPTVSRMVAARRQELAYPLRWYSIPNLWRYERPQRGRLREHWQLNVDVFGLSGLEAEHELITTADGIMQAFHAKRDMYSIKLNSRKLMNGVMHDYLRLDETQSHTLAKLIDRMHKIDYAEFMAQADALFTPTQRESGKSEELFKFLKATTLDEIPAELKAHASIGELRLLMNRLEKSGVYNIVFDPTLMRGFDYYTDVVFEVFDNHPENNRSMFGGGRYDGLVGLFGVEPVPTVGFGMGDVTLQNFLETHSLLPELYAETEAYAVLIGDVYDAALPVIKGMREMGLNIAVDPTDRKMDKKIKTADKKGAHYVIFIGEKELEEEQYVLKNLKTGQEERHGAERIVSIVKDYRTHDSN
ncbi:MAG: hisS [Candidatus Saccharibacteria bacterium]|nr:hisS [Candidatus Saccharibacteria bacterium]